MWCVCVCVVCARVVCVCVQQKTVPSHCRLAAFVQEVRKFNVPFLIVVFKSV